MNIPVALPGLLPLTLIAVWWARRLARRESAPRWVRHLPVAILLAVGASAAVSVWGLVRSMSAVGAGDSANKATRLAEGISLALNATACGYLAVLVALAACAIISWRARPAAGGGARSRRPARSR